MEVVELTRLAAATLLISHGGLPESSSRVMVQSAVTEAGARYLWLLSIALGHKSW